MRKNPLIILLALSFTIFLNAQNYTPLDYYFNGTPTHGIKIKTNIPFQNGNAMPTVMLEGFNYGETHVIDLKLNWYVYNGEFIRYNASSSGSYAPEIKLANDNGNVSIYINEKKYYNRFTIRVYANGLSETSSMFSGWTAVDEPISGTNIKTVIYKKDFGNDIAINANGNMGIGVANPGAPLDIFSDDASNHWVSRINTNGNNWSGFYDVSKDISLILRDNTGNTDIYLRPNSNSYVKGGNFGIGTSSPMEKLHVNGTTTITGDIGTPTVSHYSTGAHTLELQNGDAGDVVLSFHRAGYTNAAIKHSSLGGLIFSGSGNYDDTHLHLGSSGDLGIGTTDTKGFKLGVEGKIAAEEVKVATYANWSDFVFYKDYNLPTLKEVEQHIKSKGHLKDIPNAEKVKQDGFYLAEMNAKLLQKIEELTLYTIDQEKRIESLETKNEKLLALVEKLLESQVEK